MILETAMSMNENNHDLKPRSTSPSIEIPKQSVAPEINIQPTTEKPTESSNPAKNRSRRPSSSKVTTEEPTFIVIAPTKTILKPPTKTTLIAMQTPRKEERIFDIGMTDSQIDWLPNPVAEN
jgi:hypothetical protein